MEIIELLLSFGGDVFLSGCCDLFLMLLADGGAGYSGYKMRQSALSGGDHNTNFWSKTFFTLLPIAVVVTIAFIVGRVFFFKPKP